MKKFTKILSLALALALVLSTTAFAATVYYTNDFTGYATIDEAKADMNTVTNAYQNTTYLLNAKSSTGKDLIDSTNYGATTSSSVPAFTTDAAGVKWFKFITAEQTGNALTYPSFLLVAPDTTWNYTTNTDETFVVSYDIKVAPTGTASKTLEAMSQTYWTDAAGTGKAVDRMFAYRIESDTKTSTEFINVRYSNGQYEATSKNGSETFTGMLNTGSTYRMVASYTYDENYTWPYEETFINGELLGQSTTTGSNSTSSANPVMVGFSIPYMYVMGQSVANIKAYTIANSETLGVADIAGVVPMNNAKVTVKFNQPVYAATFNAADVEVSGLTNGTDFTVGKVKDVVEGNNIYSAFDINFSKMLTGNETYTITVPAAVKNEIGTAITDATATFTTEKAPTYNIALTANEGLSSSGTALTAATIGGKTVYFTATATNDTGKATSGALVIGIYDGEGNLVKYAFANKSFEDGAANTFTAAFKVEAGQTAKAYVVGSASIGALQ